MIRTVQELIDELNKIEYKTKHVYFQPEDDEQAYSQALYVELDEEGDVIIVID